MNRKTLLVNLISFSVLLIIAFIDYYTGYEFGFFIFYFIPVSISAWFAGRWSGIIVAFVSAICWYFSDLYSHHPYSKAYLIYWETFIRLISFLTTTLTVAQIKQMKVNEKRLKTELEKVKEELLRPKKDT